MKNTKLKTKLPFMEMETKRKKKIKFSWLIKNLFSFIFLILILFPFFVQAQEGLVPCGPGHNPPNDVCKFCHIFVLFKKIVDFVLFTIVPPVAILMIVIGGVMFFMATGNPSKVTSAKNLLTSVIIGLVIIYTAWVLVSAFFAFIGLSDFGLKLTGPDKWFEVQCP